MHRQRNTEGFTLIEALLVIGISAVGLLSLLASTETSLKAQGAVQASGGFEEKIQSLFIAARSTDLCAGMLKLGGGAIDYYGTAPVEIEEIKVNGRTLAREGEIMGGGFAVTSITLEPALTSLSAAAPLVRYLSPLRLTTRRIEKRSLGVASHSRTILLEVVAHHASGTIYSCSASNFASSSGVSMVQVSMNAEVSLFGPTVGKVNNCYRGFAPDSGFGASVPCLETDEFNSHEPGGSNWISQQLDLNTCSIPEGRVLTRGVRLESPHPNNPAFVACEAVQSSVNSAWKRGYPTPTGIPSRNSGTYGIAGTGPNPAHATPDPIPAPPYTPLEENSIDWDQCQITLSHLVPLPKALPNPLPAATTAGEEHELELWKTGSPVAGGNCSVARNPALGNRWVVQASMRGIADVRCRVRCVKFVLN